MPDEKVDSSGGHLVGGSNVVVLTSSLVLERELLLPFLFCIGLSCINLGGDLGPQESKRKTHRLVMDNLF